MNWEPWTGYDDVTVGGVVEKINPFKQTNVAKEPGIDITDGKRLF